MLGKEAYIQYLNQSDQTVKKAVELLESGEAFPKAPNSGHASRVINTFSDNALSVESEYFFFSCAIHLRSCFFLSIFLFLLLRFYADGSLKGIDNS